MYEKFDKSAKEAMDIAQQEAKTFCCEYLGTEHILSGVLKQNGVGSQAIRNFDIDPKQIIEHMGEIFGPLAEDGKRSYGEELLLTPRAKKVLKLAEEYCSKLNQNSVNTGHLLYGCSARMDFVSAQILANFLDCSKLEKELTSLLKTGESSSPLISILDSAGRPFRK